MNIIQIEIARREEIINSRDLKVEKVAELREQINAIHSEISNIENEVANINVEVLQNEIAELKTYLPVEEVAVEEIVDAPIENS